MTPPWLPANTLPRPISIYTGGSSECLHRNRISEGLLHVAEGFTSDLVFEAGVAALLAILIAWHDLPPLLAIPVRRWSGWASPLLFFGEFFDGSWCMADDLCYFNDSAAMLRGGFNPISVLITPDGIDALTTAAVGHHVLYYWWNMVAMYLFGEHYYAAIFLNVVLTFVTGFFLVRIARLLGFSRNYQIGLLLFYLLHWDIITWGSFVNLKDCLVQMLTVAGMYCAVRFCQLRDWFSVVGFLLILQLFYWLRFYLAGIDSCFHGDLGGLAVERILASIFLVPDRLRCSVSGVTKPAAKQA